MLTEKEKAEYLPFSLTLICFCIESLADWRNMNILLTEGFVWTARNA